MKAFAIVVVWLSNWFILAIRYLENISERVIDDIKKDKSFESVKYILKTNGDNENVKAIINKLNYDEQILTLKVYEYYDDFGYSRESKEPIEIKEFKDIDEVRSYLVSQYKVPFSKASGNITDFEYNNDDYDGYHFVVE